MAADLSVETTVLFLAEVEWRFCRFRTVVLLATYDIWVDDHGMEDLLLLEHT